MRKKENREIVKIEIGRFHTQGLLFRAMSGEAVSYGIGTA